MRPSYFWLASLLVLLVGFFTRVLELDGVSLWYDETVTRVIVRQESILETFELLLSDPTHLPLYFALTQLVRPESDFIFRLPNVFIGLLSIAFIMRVAISLYKDYNLALLVGGLLAINPYAIWLARTARPNALLLLVVLMAAYSFFQIVQGKKSSLHWTLFILSSMAAYTTHYYAAVLPMAQYFYFAFTLRNNRKFFWQWIGAQLIAVSPLFVWWYGLTQQEGIALGIGWIPEPRPQDLALTFWNMSVGYEGETYFYEIIGVLVAAVGVSAGIYAALRYWKNNLVDFFWFWMAVPPLLLIFGLSFFRPLYVDRYFMFLLPSLLFLMVRGWRFMTPPPTPLLEGEGSRDGRTRGLNSLSVFVAVFAVICLLNFGVGLAEKEHEHQDWRGVVAYVEENRQPNDAQMIVNELMVIPFLSYFEDDIPVLNYTDGAIQEMPTPAPEYIWLVYQDGQADVHRQGELPNFGFEDLPPDLQAWLETQNVTYRRVYTGVILIGVEYE